MLNRTAVTFSNNSFASGRPNDFENPAPRITIFGF
jgi:hypothetical protein